MNSTEPTLILDEARAKGNIANMVAKAKKNNLKFRPHFKTHQSKQVGQWFKEAGVSSITVSSLGMAMYFAEAEWEEITVAFPVNIKQISAINALAQKVKLHLLVDGEESVKLLSEAIDHPVHLFIEIDTGSNRSGVACDDSNQIKAIAACIAESKHLNLHGCYAHAGHTYGAKSATEVASIAEKAFQKFTDVRKYFDSGEKLEFCWGDTPSCSVLHTFDGVDALSPGNFVFYDAMQYEIGSCSLEEIAVALYCPVVSKKSRVNEICVYAGAIHLSKDHITIDEQTVFGVLVDTESWMPLKGSAVRAISQEHGIIMLSSSDFKRLAIGDTVAIVPIHSCLTAQAMGTYWTKDGLTLDHYAQKNRGGSHG